ncbi:MAG TPA: oligosaccharide flippase family protein, partial [Candidatus Polarisedimenticolaceae bacterium]|nr:oligosaccharide flippase family protein [Candidatus Polarisedimenticolaceae bacterium]
MKLLIARARNSSFLRNNVIYFIGSFGISVLNYLYYPVLGRLLQPADFGEVQTVMSFFLQTSIFMQVLGLVSIGVIARYRKPEERSRIIAEYSRLAFYIGLCIFVITVLVSPFLKSFFQFDSVLPFIAFGLVVLVTVPLTFANSFLQAGHRFGDLSRSGIIASAAKLVLSALLVFIGLKAFGAIAAIALAQALALVYTLFKTPDGKPVIMSGLRFKKPRFSVMRSELPYAGLVLVASLTVNVVLGLDIIVIKHYFDPHTAGLYAGIATIARIIFYVTAPLALVLIASVKPANAKLNRQLLLRSAGLTLLTGGGCLIA